MPKLRAAARDGGRGRIWDEAPDHAGYAEHRVPPDVLLAQHFDERPVRDADGQPDPAHNR
jgi:hypothetical protein